MPSSVQVGSDLTTAPRYYYSYNGHGDVVALTDATGTTVATYSYDTFGTPTIWESFTNGWHNPYLYDGFHRVRYDSETGLYWMSVRAYDPSLGRFISHDPLGRAPVLWAMQAYAYGGNNPLRNVDPSGQFSRVTIDGGYRGTDETAAQEAAFEARVYTLQGSSPVGTTGGCDDRCKSTERGNAQFEAGLAANHFGKVAFVLGLVAAAIGIVARLAATWALQAAIDASFAAVTVWGTIFFGLLAIALWAVSRYAAQVGEQLGVLAGEATAVALLFGGANYERNISQSYLWGTLQSQIYWVFVGGQVANGLVILVNLIHKIPDQALADQALQGVDRTGLGLAMDFGGSVAFAADVGTWMARISDAIPDVQ